MGHRLLRAGNNHACVEKVMVRKVRRFAASGAGHGFRCWASREKYARMQPIVQNRCFLLYLFKKSKLGFSLLHFQCLCGLNLLPVQPAVLSLRTGFCYVACVFLRVVVEVVLRQRLLDSSNCQSSLQNRGRGVEEGGGTQ